MADERNNDDIAAALQGLDSDSGAQPAPPSPSAVPLARHNEEVGHATVLN